jgi:ketosteroid isomerase-like protein
MSAEENKKVVEKMMAAFTAGRMDEVLGSLSDSATWWVAGTFPLSGTKTKKEFAELVGGIADSVEGSIRLSPKAWTVEGDRVAVEVESYAKLKNGRVYNNFYHFLIEVRNGKIQKVREYLDTMHANETFCV